MVQASDNVVNQQARTKEGVARDLQKRQTSENGQDTQVGQLNRAYTWFLIKPVKESAYTNADEEEEFEARAIRLKQMLSTK